MSRYMIKASQRQGVCPKCKGLLVSLPDPIFSTQFRCRDCNTTYWCVGSGLSDHDYDICDNYSEALIALSCLDDMR